MVDATWVRLLKWMRPLWKQSVAALLLGVATVGSGMGLMMTSAYIISAAALHPSIAVLQVAIVGVRVFGISRGVARYFERLVSHNLNLTLLTQIRVWLYERLEPLAPARLQSFGSGDLLTRIVADVNGLEHFYVRVLAPPLVAGVIWLIVLLLFSSFGGMIALTVGLCMAVAGVAVPGLVRKAGVKPGQRQIQARKEMNEALVEGIQGLPDLLAFGAEERYLADIQRLSDEVAHAQRQSGDIATLSDAAIGLIMNLTVAAALIVAIPRVTGGQLDGVYLAVIVLGIMAAFEAIAPLPTALQFLDGSLRSARRLFEVVDAVPAVVDPPAPRPLPASVDLTVTDLTFRYGPDDALVLDGVSFDLPAGKRLAIVGVSGAGKSTLLNLLLRFWDVAPGRIRLGGQDMRDLRADQVRAQIGVVSQRTHLFNDTIRGNLLIADPQADDDALEAACRQAQIHDFILGLPDGYDTWIG